MKFCVGKHKRLHKEAKKQSQLHMQLNSKLPIITQAWDFDAELRTPGYVVL